MGSVVGGSNATDKMVNSHVRIVYDFNTPSRSNTEYVMSRNTSMFLNLPARLVSALFLSSSRPQALHHRITMADETSPTARCLSRSMAPSITLVFFSPAGHAEPEVRQDMAFTASTETGCGSAASYTNMFTNHGRVRRLRQVQREHGVHALLQSIKTG
jgi:hypothetical protein